MRKAWQADQDRYERIFDQIGTISRDARQAIETGQPKALGPLMNDNHFWLHEINVSSPELASLIEMARQAGALGAKLSGGGRGGNLIALTTPHTATVVAKALDQAGAMRTITTQVGR